MKIINIGKEYSDTPVGRYVTDGDFTGEGFRETLLKPALQQNAKVTVDLDDVEGCGSSFLEEAFGGLVRNKYFTKAELEEKLIIKSEKPNHAQYPILIWKYIREA